MKGRVLFRLPFATPSLNEWGKWHWSKRARWRDECRLLVRYVIKQRALLPPPHAPVQVDILRKSSGQLDYDNLVGGCKGLLDAMRLEGVLYDDSPQWVRVTYRQEKISPKQLAVTEISVSPIESCAKEA